MIIQSERNEAEIRSTLDPAVWLQYNAQVSAEVYMETYKDKMERFTSFSH